MVQVLQACSPGPDHAGNTAAQRWHKCHLTSEPASDPPVPDLPLFYRPKGLSASEAASAEGLVGPQPGVQEAAAGEALLGSLLP